MTKAILAVDDSASIRKLVSFTLVSAGYDVTEAVDGCDAFAKASAAPFDLVLTDQHMPRVDGLTLVGRLRAMPAYQSTPILMLTTDTSDALQAQGRTAGVSGWLFKPFDPRQLTDLVRQVVDRATD